MLFRSRGPLLVIRVSGLHVVFPLGCAQGIVNEKFVGVPNPKKESVDSGIDRIFAITAAKMPEDHPQLSGKGHRKRRAVDSLLNNGDCGKSLCILPVDRKSTRLNSSHLGISYAV